MCVNGVIGQKCEYHDHEWIGLHIFTSMQKKIMVILIRFPCTHHRYQE